MIAHTVILADATDRVAVTNDGTQTRIVTAGSMSDLILSARVIVDGDAPTRADFLRRLAAAAVAAADELAGERVAS